MEILITGANSFVARQLDIKATRMTHQDCDLTDWRSVYYYNWEGDVIVHCAHSGQFGKDERGQVEDNIAMFVNMRRRWPKAKIIAFGSGAMHDKSKPIVKASAYDYAMPSDNYGLSKRLTVDLADVTLIPFGIYGSRFVQACRTGSVTIYQDCLYSWIMPENLTGSVMGAIKKEGRFNLCEFDMTLVDVARREEADYQVLVGGWANEYTGKHDKILLRQWR